jgi:hypothetical protein
MIEVISVQDGSREKSGARDGASSAVHTTEMSAAFSTATQASTIVRSDARSIRAAIREFEGIGVQVDKMGDAGLRLTSS